MLKFPPIQKLVVKDTAEMKDNDPRKGVCVHENHAIVVDDQMITCFDLKRYFINENGIDDEDRMADLDNVLRFMNGRRFSIPFWTELTKGAIISVSDHTLELEGAVRKDLIYFDEFYNSKGIATLLTNNVSSEPMSIPRAAFELDQIVKLLSAFKTMLKKDSIALEYIGTNTMIRYTFKQNPWLFGLISSDPMFTTKGFIFHYMAHLETTF